MTLQQKSSIFRVVFQVFRNIKIGVFIALVNFLIQGVSFLVQNLIAKNLGTSEYGFFGILQTDYSIFCSIADFGMNTLILAFFGKKATSGSLFHNVLQLRFFCTVATAFLMLIFAFTVRRGHPVFYGELILIFGLLFQHAFFDWYFICGKFWKKLFISKLLHSLSYCIVMGISLLYFKIDKIALIALAMVLSALPAFFFGVTNVFDKSLLKISSRTFHFIRMMILSAIPYALSGFAAFAYIPIGLYVADKFASAEFLSSYNFANKILVLCSGIMVHFISSSLVTQHSDAEKDIHIKDIGLFTAFIAACSSPLWLFPQQFLKILFFAVSWTEKDLSCSGYILRTLSFSLLFQAARTSLISTLLKGKATWTYAIIVSTAGAANIIACTLAGIYLSNGFIPVFALTGDIVITVILLSYFFHKDRIRW